MLKLKCDQLVKIYRLWGALPPPLQRPAEGPAGVDGISLRPHDGGSSRRGLSKGAPEAPGEAHRPSVVAQKGDSYEVREGDSNFHVAAPDLSPTGRVLGKSGRKVRLHPARTTNRRTMQTAPSASAIATPQVTWISGATNLPRHHLMQGSVRSETYAAISYSWMSPPNTSLRVH